MVEAGDVRLGHVGHLQPADRWKDEATEVPAILPRGARLEADRDVLLVEALGKLGNRERVAALLSITGRILAVLDRGEQAERFGPRLLGGEHAMLAQAHAAVARTDPVLNDVVALPAGQDADGEAAQLVVTDNVVLLANLGDLDEPLGDLGHGDSAPTVPLLRGRSPDRRPCRGITMESRGRVSTRVQAKDNVRAGR
jgi:hypothetical protein